MIETTFLMAFSLLIGIWAGYQLSQSNYRDELNYLMLESDKLRKEQEAFHREMRQAMEISGYISHED